MLFSNILDADVKNYIELLRLAAGFLQQHVIWFARRGNFGPSCHGLSTTCRLRGKRGSDCMFCAKGSHSEIMSICSEMPGTCPIV